MLGYAGLRLLWIWRTVSPDSGRLAPESGSEPAKTAGLAARITGKLESWAKAAEEDARE